jgi:DNA-binding NtrC family response regulator
LIMSTNKTASILVIDDEKVICKGCRYSLSGMGHQVSCCMTAGDGLEEINTRNYDVILLDLKLPDIEGMEILRQVMSQRPDECIIIMTGYSTVKNAVEAMKLGAFDYLTKPFTDDELIITVQKAIEKKSLVGENKRLRKELMDRYSFSNMIGKSPALLEVFKQIQKVAPTDSTVLLQGESGTGKELVARAIHAHSQRVSYQFVAVDCSTLTPSLLESELFGHVRGAFTGASRDRRGIFEIAQKGTLFLDDIINLSMDIQAKLLRVLEAHEYKPVGASQFRKTNVRVVAATNKDLQTLVAEGSFREDLYYRFNVFPITLPPLRERRDDIPRLAYHFLHKFSRKTGKRITGFSDESLELLMNHHWPGNVRQLKNFIERLVIISDGDSLDLSSISNHLYNQNKFKKTQIPANIDQLKKVKRDILKVHFEPIQRAFLVNALNVSDGNISQAAKGVGLQRSNFSNLMKQLGLKTQRK